METTSVTERIEPQPEVVHDLPFVSVVIPCFNEQRFITKALTLLAEQYEKSSYEIIVVDGRSTDGTRRLIEEFKLSHPDLAVKILNNPARNIPCALNLGIAAARGSIIARMDAHACPTPGYVRRCVEVIEAGQAGVVGMPCQVRPGADTLTAKAIAFCVSHPFGIGDAKYRLREGGPIQEEVDTVAFACFKKELWAKLGGFNEELLTNEDYDFNYRVRLQGESVILDRSGHCDYFARASFRGLAAQYRRYGTWKARMVRKHPRSIKLRHLVAPAFVLSFIVLGIGGIVWRPLWLLLALEVMLYLLLAGFFAATARTVGGGGLKYRLLLPVVFLTIHLNWGAAFLRGLFTDRKKK
jgi:glycosyltransferase involved in cell wall biosynthesis